MKAMVKTVVHQRNYHEETRRKRENKMPKSSAARQSKTAVRMAAKQSINQVQFWA